jgi:putative FmdB family regulatory protein
MPIYEFECRTCNHTFEQIMGIAETDQNLACPKCDSTNLKKIVGPCSFHSRERYEERLANRMSSRAHGK